MKPALINLSKRLICRRRICRALISERASILIIVLWSLCILTTYAVILGYTVRQKLILVARLDERAKLRLIAEAGINKAIVELDKLVKEEYDALNSEWSNNTAAFKGIKIGDGEVDIAYTVIDELSGLPDTHYGLVDEESKININKVDQTVLRRLFKLVVGSHDVEAQELAASIVDWRDADSELSIPLGSAEDRDYRNRKFPYEAKDSDFEVLEELLLVNGMDELIFNRLKDYITIYGDGKININTASSSILLALGLQKDIVDDIILFRQGEDRVTGTSDDQIFDSTSSIVPRISQLEDLSPSLVAAVTEIANKYLITNSKNFTIKCTARLRTSDSAAQVICVIDRDSKVLYWHEL